MARLFHLPQAVRIDSTGAPYAGAKAYFYLTGTTTPTDTYTDNALGTPHANPVVADSGGQWAAIYLDPAITYRCIIKTTADVTLDDVDPVHAPITGSQISITDSGGYFAGTEVETILQDVGANYTKNAATETITADWTWSGADINMGDNLIIRPEIKDFGVTHNSISSSSGTLTIDCSTGNSFVTTLTENVTTVTLSNASASGTFCQVTIRIIQDGGGGAYTVTWPAAVKFPGGTDPVISTGNDAIDLITLQTIDGGTTWLGNFAQAYA